MSAGRRPQDESRSRIAGASPDAARRLFRRGLAVASLTILAACGGGGKGGPGPTPDPGAPTLSCPADVQADAHNGTDPTITFDTPVPQNGAPPVTVTCTPASGGTFPVGSTSVTCTASDAMKRTASCSFTVDVSAVPRISEVRFVAFGDSITAGTTSPAPETLVTSPPDSYPYKLKALLAARYADQQIEMLNEGQPKENVNDAGKRRFRAVLDDDKPDVVLVLEGANDLNLAYAATGDPKTAIPLVIAALEEMAKEAKARKIPMLLATLTPEDPEGKNGHGAPALPDLNSEIRVMAKEEGAIVVDLFNGLGGTPKGSIGIDGLHPTPEGYTKIAQIWFDVIQKNFEQKAATGSPKLALRVSAPSGVPAILARPGR